MAAVPLTQFAVHLRPADNIAVAARGIPAGTSLAFDGGTVTVPGGIEMGVHIGFATGHRRRRRRCWHHNRGRQQRYKHRWRKKS